MTQAEMPTLDWRDLRFVLAIHRAASLAGAAARLGVDESTVARHLKRAERRLAARLFERHPTGLTATAAGDLLVQAAERVEQEVQRVEQAVTGSDHVAAGSVRVTAVPVVVDHLLLPALPALLDREPALAVELVAEPRDLNLTRRETDLALRLARPTRETGVVARRVGVLDYAVYAPAGATPGDLPWIGYDDTLSHLPQARWIAERVSRHGEPLARVRVNDANSVLAAVRAGIGRALLPVLVGERDPALARIGGGAPVLGRPLWLIVHPDLRALARIRVVMEWLAATVPGG